MYFYCTPGRVAQSVTRLTVDACLTADPGAPAPSYTFMEIDHEIITTAFSSIPQNSRRVVVSYKRSTGVSLSQTRPEKVCLGELTSLLTGTLSINPSKTTYTHRTNDCFEDRMSF